MILTIPFSIILFITLTTAAVGIYNLVTRPVLEYRPRTDIITKPRLSILIPARNEEKTIGRLLRTIGQQTYRNIEIIVLDDHSEDRTAEIVRSAANTEPRLRLIDGKPLPKGWTGKNWACHQLALQAKGDLLLFIDADVELVPEAISSAVATIENSTVAMLSVFPTQLMESFGERLVVPLMNWILLSFLPLRLVSNSQHTRFVAANGQFILIWKDTYQEVGGHAAMKDKIVEDMEIARALKKSGHRILTLLGGDMIACRMYSGVTESVNGFTKNFYAGFNTSPIGFILVLLLMTIVFLGPFIAVIEYPLFVYPIVLILLNRLSISVLSRQSIIYNIILHPIQILFMAIIGFLSVEAYTSNQILWKGRRL